jgi:hypothetical protein
MKKLHLNIERVHIKAKDPGVLSTLIADVDKQMQKLVASTDSISALMAKYITNNDGEQYDKATTALRTLRKNICESAMTINDLEMQVVAFQNKVYRFEGSNKSAPPPKKIVIKEIKSTSHTNVQYGMSEMRIVATGLANYCENARAAIKGIIMAKNRIGSVWVDPQFKDFSSVVDTVKLAAEKHIKELDLYVAYLNTRIKEFRS